MVTVIGARSVPKTGIGGSVRAGADRVVVMVRNQPAAMEPRSPGPSSKTYKDHAPLAEEPLNAERVARYGPAGAGTVNVSPVPTLVGLNVPEISGPLSRS